MKISQWTVWLADLDPVVGSEQGRTRPVLIISKSLINNILPVVNVIPITSRKSNRRVYPNEAVLPSMTSGLAVESIALCYQLRTLDKRRLTRQLGTLHDFGVQRQVVKALRFQLGL